MKKLLVVLAMTISIISCSIDRSWTKSAWESDGYGFTITYPSDWSLVAEAHSELSFETVFKVFPSIYKDQQAAENGDIVAFGLVRGMKCEADSLKNFWELDPTDDSRSWSSCVQGDGYTIVIMATKTKVDQKILDEIIQSLELK